MKYVENNNPYDVARLTFNGMDIPLYKVVDIPDYEAQRRLQLKELAQSKVDDLSISKELIMKLRKHGIISVLSLSRWSSRKLVFKANLSETEILEVKQALRKKNLMLRAA